MPVEKGKKMRRTVDDKNEIQVQQFVRESKEILRPYLEEPGLVIYSHKSTLRRNLVLFYGFNPGYDPSKEHCIRWSIGQSIERFADGFDSLRKRTDADSDKLTAIERLHTDCNLIDDQCWPFPSFRKDYRVGRARYQSNTRSLLTQLGCGDALITNGLFLQSIGPEVLRDQLGRNGYQELVDACWKVHELIFEITQPRVIIACASVVNDVLRERLGLTLKPGEPPLHSGYQNWKCQHWIGSWKDKSEEERRIVVCQVPHMSFYNVGAEYSRKAGVPVWAKAIVDAATTNWNLAPFQCSGQ